MNRAKIVLIASAAALGLVLGCNVGSNPAEKSFKDYAHSIGMTDNEADKYAMFVCDKEYELADVLLYYMADQDQTMTEEDAAVISQTMQARAMMARCPVGLSR